MFSKRISIMFLGLIALCFGGCASVGHEGSFEINRNQRGCMDDLDDQLKVLDLKKVFTELSRELCRELPEKCKGSGATDPLCTHDTTVLVTDFVDLKSLDPKPAGILMGELMRTSLNTSCSYGIQQAELSKFFTLTEKGLVVLTRNIDSIRQDDVSNKDFIVGTFSHTPEKLILFVKRFDLTSGKITHMSSKEIDFSCSDSTVSYRFR